MAASTHPDVAHRYDLYEMVRFSATVVPSGAGAPIQPSSMVFHIGPLGSVASYIFGQAGASIVSPAAGCFYRDFAPNSVGTWAYGFHASGIAYGRNEWVFIVDPSNVV
jgi:hypothetical protein